MAEQLTFIVKALIQETPDTLSIVLESKDGNPLQYLPGQFLTFLFNFRGTEIRRSYSLSSAPGIDTYPTITFKRIPNGEISNYLFHYIKAGDELRAIAPAGRFTYTPEKREARDIFLIAAGTGISPIFSILKTALLNENQSRVILIYSNRNEQNTIFLKEIQALEQKHASRFKCIYILSSPVNKDHPYKAHLNIALLEQLVNQNTSFSKQSAQFFLCGPFEYMRMIQMTLIAMGYDDEQIHKENFVVKEAVYASAYFPITDQGPREITISYNGADYSFSAPYDKNLLQAGLDNGLSLPYSCRGGVCGTCTAKCTEGNVWMAINEVLSDKDIKNGLVLTCTGYALTKEVKLEF